ncbi:MAG: hypothetical protein HC914_12600 [Chloroflexaceae bacterium]|nr:hypothetical protein [Chloroflexaceae bacterium]
MKIYNVTPSSAWQSAIQRMDRLYPKLPPAQQHLLEFAVWTGATIEDLACQMNKSPSTIRNQMYSIREKAAEVGYDKYPTWHRILIDAGIYFAYCQQIPVTKS